MQPETAPSLSDVDEGGQHVGQLGSQGGELVDHDHQPRHRTAGAPQRHQIRDTRESKLLLTVVQLGPQARQSALTEMGVELILGGHLHRAYIGNSLDVHPGRRRDQGITIVQSGTTTSGRGRAREQEKNSFNRIRIGTRVVEITHYMLFEQTGRFEPFSVHAFPRRRQGWFETGMVQLPLDAAVRGTGS